MPFTEAIEIVNLADITLPSEARLRELLDRVKRASVHLTISARTGATLNADIGVAAAATALVPAAARLIIDEAAG